MNLSEILEFPRLEVGDPRELSSQMALTKAKIRGDPFQASY